jgi:hypothetical protein
MVEARVGCVDVDIPVAADVRRCNALNVSNAPLASL